MSFEKGIILKNIDYIASRNSLKVDTKFIERVIDYALTNTNISPHLLFGVTNIVINTICEANIIVASFLYRLKISSNIQNINLDISNEILLIIDEVIYIRDRVYNSKILPNDINKFRQFLLSLTTDIRSIIIVVIDFLDHIQVARKTESLEKQKQISEKGIEIIIPISQYLGIESITQSLQNTILSVSHPEDIESITEYLEKLEEKYRAVVNSIVPNIIYRINTTNIYATITSRKKSIYSIWEKTLRKNYAIDSLDDLIGLRVIVNTIEECYQVLGIIHTSYKISNNSFYDYISNPKSNGYQSIHTVISGLFEFNIEVQIRTKRMDAVAKSGIASHWLYKNECDLDQHKWVVKLQEKLYVEDSIYKLKKDKNVALHYDKLFCFSNTNKIFILPVGSIVIDFAFHLGEDFGKYYSKAKVNNKFVSPNTLLSNGDKVEIIISDISDMEIDFRNYNYSNLYKKYSCLGEIILNNICVYLDIEKDYKFQLDLVNKMQIQYQDLLYNIGKDKITVCNLVNEISKFRYTYKGFDFLKRTSVGKLDKIILTNIKQNTKIELAYCCMPIPGESIVAINSVGNRAIIHTRECKVINKFLRSPNLIIHAYWNPNIVFDREDYSCKMQIKFNYNKAILSNIINYISMYKIVYIKYMPSLSNSHELLCTIKFKNSLQFNSICNYLLKRIKVTSITKYIS